MELAMADEYPLRVKTTTVTSGTGSYVLAVVPLASAHLTPKQAVAASALIDGSTVQYLVIDSTIFGNTSNIDIEAGEGVYDDATNTITRSASTVWANTVDSPGVLRDWPASGTRDVLLLVSPSVQGARIDRANTFTEDQNIIKSAGAVLFSLNTDDASNLDISLLNSIKTWVLRNNSSGVLNIVNTSDGRTPFKLFAGALDNAIAANATGVGTGVQNPETEFHVQENSIHTKPTVEIKQLGTGDAGAGYSIVGRSYVWGIDNSDDDKFKLSTAASSGGAVLGVNDIIDVTAAGVVNIVNALTVDDTPVDFESGTKMTFHQATSPTFWSKDVSAVTGRAIRIIGGAEGVALGSGGSIDISSANTVGHVLTTAQLPSHDHDANSGESFVITDTNAGFFIPSGGSGIGSAIGGSATAATGSNNSHSHGLAFRFQDVIAATKD